MFILLCLLIQLSIMLVKVKMLSHVQLLATSWTAAYQAPPSVGFSRQEYWSGVPSPSLAGKEKTGQVERAALTYALPCVKQLASGKLLCSTGGSAQGSVMTKRGGMRQCEEGSRGRRYTHTYGWLAGFTAEINIVKQLIIMHFFQKQKTWNKKRKSREKKIYTTAKQICSFHCLPVTLLLLLSLWAVNCM